MKSREELKQAEAKRAKARLEQLSNMRKRGEALPQMEAGEITSLKKIAGVEKPAPRPCRPGDFDRAMRSMLRLIAQFERVSQ